MNLRRSTCLTGIALFAALPCTGCWQNQLPATYAVRLPDPPADDAAAGGESEPKLDEHAARVVVAPADSGPAILANTRWRVFGIESTNLQSEDPTPELASSEWDLGIVEFGARGELISFEPHEVSYRGIRMSDVLGPTIILDNAAHPATAPGAFYVSESYGAFIGEDFGLASIGRYFVGPVMVGEATMELTGRLVADAAGFDGTLRFSATIGSLDDPAAAPDILDNLIVIHAVRED